MDGVSLGGLLLGCVGFDEFAVFEGGVGPDFGGEVGGADSAPAVLGGFDEFECHCDPGSPATRPFGDALT